MMIKGYFSSNPAHPIKNKQYNIVLTVYESVPTIWVRPTITI